MINRPAPFALIIKLAANPAVVPKSCTTTIPTAILWLESVTTGPLNQLGPLGNKDWINWFYVAKSHIKTICIYCFPNCFKLSLIQS